MKLQNQPHSKIGWPELLSAAETHREPYQDVRVVTAKSEFVKKAYDSAAACLKHDPRRINDSKVIDPIAINIIQSGFITVQPHVTVSSDGISVCVNADTVDEESTWKALDMVADALDQLEGNSGTVYFDVPLTYTTTEIPWLYRN